MAVRNMTVQEFLDSSNPDYGFVRAGIMSPRTYLGDQMRCAKQHVMLMSLAYSKGVQVLVGPELGLTGGYSMGDGVHKPEVQKNSLLALKYVLDETADINMLTCLGLVLKYRSILYNVVAVVRNGRIIAIIPKLELPNYLQFIEGKHYGTGEGIDDLIDLFDQTGIPFGPDVLIESKYHPDLILSVLVCEDFWATMDKGSTQALNGATFFAVPSGSPDLVAKKQYQLDLCKIRSSLYFGAVLYGSSGRGESSDLTIMGGRRIVAEVGRILTHEDRYMDRRGESQIPGLTISDIDTQIIAHERQIDSTFHANARRNRADYRFVSVEGKLGIDDPEVYQKLYRKVETFPFVPKDPVERSIRAREIQDICVEGLIDKLLNTGIEHVVIGISGGVDSFAALSVCLEAFDALELPRTNIHAITMPGKSTQGGTYDRAVRTIKAAGVSFEEIGVSEIAQLLLKSIGHDGITQNVTYENAHADARKDILFLSTSDRGYVAIVIGTSGLTEILLGWCTKFADHACDWDPNASKPKSMIRYIVMEFAESIKDSNPDLARVAIETAEAKATPDLADEQETEDKIGDLNVHDFIIAHAHRYHMAPTKVMRLIVETDWVTTYSFEYLKWVMSVYLTRRHYNHHKTAVPMLGPMVGTISADTHKVFQIPSDMVKGALDASLEELARVPSTL